MKQLVMYMGERPQVFSRKIRQLFKTKDGTEMFWVGVKGVWFGEVYEVNDGKMEVRPKRVEKGAWEPTDAEEKEYEAQKLVCTRIRQERRSEMKIKKPHDDVLRAVKLLRPFYRALDDMDRGRFMKWVSNECSKRVKK